MRGTFVFIISRGINFANHDGSANLSKSKPTRILAIMQCAIANYLLARDFQQSLHIHDNHIDQSQRSLQHSDKVPGF